MEIVNIQWAGVDPENGARTMYIVSTKNDDFYLHINTRNRMADELLKDLSDALTAELEETYRLQTMAVDYED